jgi:hypothetical protein
MAMAMGRALPTTKNRVMGMLTARTANAHPKATRHPKAITRHMAAMLTVTVDTLTACPPRAT